MTQKLAGETTAKDSRAHVIAWPQLLQLRLCKGLPHVDVALQAELPKFMSAFPANNVRLICKVHLRMLSGSICSG
jgi:hypothetical protein